MANKFDWNQFEQAEQPFDWNQFEQGNPASDLQGGLGYEGEGKPFFERGLVGNVKRGGQQLFEGISEGFEASKQINEINRQRQEQGLPSISAKESGIVKFGEGLVDPRNVANLLTTLTEEESGEKVAGIIPNQLSEDSKKAHPLRWQSPEGQESPATAYSNWQKKLQKLSPEERELFEKQERGIESTLAAGQLAIGGIQGAKSLSGKAKSLRAAPKRLTGPEGPIIDVTPKPKAAPKVPATMESGLTKLRVMESKKPQYGVINPSKQKELIAGLGEEAAKIAEKGVKRQHPIIEEMASGKNPDAEFEKGFGELKATAEKYDPEIDTGPIDRFLSDTGKQYRGIPRPHPEARQILQEIRALRKRPQEGMGNLLKIYRSNNKKIRNIYETSRLTGRQAEYVDFLSNLNRSIGEAFAKTLPEDSAWIKEFKRLNGEYKDYQNALKTQTILSPIIGGELNSKNVTKFTSLANDVKKQQKLRLSMGEKSANEMIQLAKDLQDATTAIKKMKAEEWKLWQKALPFGYAVPFVGKFFGMKGLYDLGTRGYGWWLSRPSRVKALDDLVRTISADDLSGFKNAVKKLEDSGDVPKPPKLPNSGKQASELSSKITEVNPKYSDPYSGEKGEILERVQDQIRHPMLSVNEFKTYFNEWNKYFKDRNKFFDYYGNKDINKELYLGTVSDLLKNEKLLKHLVKKGAKDIPVYRVPYEDLPKSYGQYVGSINPKTHKLVKDKIIIIPNLSPSRIRQLLAHEGGGHGQQARSYRKSGISRFEERRNEPKNRSSITEKNAINFEKFIVQEEQKFRKLLQKTKEQNKLNPNK